jgi:hypothetical protein
MTPSHSPTPSCSCSSATPGTTDYARSLAASRRALDDLATKLGAKQGSPLDWTPVPASVTVDLPDPELSEAEIASHSHSTANDERNPILEEPNEEYSNSYWEPDLDCWDIQQERAKDLTFPPHDAQLLDGQIPELRSILEKQSSQSS